MRWGLALTGAGLAACVGYLLLWPTPVDPIAWTPPPAPGFVGAYAPNDALADVELLPIPDGYGAEDVETDAEGRIYGGDHDGRILRWGPDGSGPEVFAETGGRTLGLHRGPDGALLAADAYAGLLSIDASGRVESLLREVDGAPLSFADDLEITADGQIYLSDASDRFPLASWKLDLLENRPNGRLLRFDLASGDVEVVLDDLHFANGVAVSHEQDFVLVVETPRYRVRRLWIDGPRAGEDEIWIGNLPGFPDGISAGEGGRYWLALAGPRDALLDGAGPYPTLRAAMTRLPEALQPAPARYAHAVALDRDGRVLCSLQDPSGGRFATVTSVQERDGWLYLGSLSEPAVARLPVPAACDP